MFLLSFKTLITPILIRFVFYISVAAAVLVGLFLFGAAGDVGRFSAAGGVLMMLGAVIVPIVLVVVFRVAAELTLVVFMIRDELAWQREQHGMPGAAE